MELMETKDIQIEVKTINSDGILVRNTKEFNDKGEEIKTTEYFLDVDGQIIDGEIEQSGFVAVGENCDGSDEEHYIAVEVENPGDIHLNEKNVISWSEICRICANTSNQFVPIFTDDGVDYDLCNKINSYLPVKVSEDDTLPHQVCYNCAATLLAWHELFKGCINAHQRLTELQTRIITRDELCHESTEEENNENLLQIENVAKIEPVTEDTKMKEDGEEDDCNTETARSKILQLANFKDFKKIYKPSLPSKKIDKSINRGDGKILSRKKVSREVKKKVGKTKMGKIKSKLKSKSSKQYLENFNSTIVEIKIENIPVQDESNKEIVKNEEENDEDYKADEDYVQDDDEDDPSPVVLKKPKSKKSRKRPRSPALIGNLECNECGKKFRQQNSYQIHMRLHTGEKPYTCHICGKQFGQAGSLYYHLKHVHGGVKNHACDICGRCFAMKTAMEDHKRIHTGERPFVCDSCGKTFKTKASLFTHSKIHNDEYPFSCSYCKKPFRWKQQMISHLTTHTGEKNHICDVCGKGFGVKNELTRHRRTHSDEKPFTCQKCGVSFGQKRYLTNHNRTRHKLKASEPGN